MVIKEIRQGARVERTQNGTFSQSRVHSTMNPIKVEYWGLERILLVYSFFIHLFSLFSEENGKAYLLVRNTDVRT